MSETKYIGAMCEIKFIEHEDYEHEESELNKILNVFIKFGDWLDDYDFTEEEYRIDESVFFYCKDKEELEELYNQEFVEDFVILSYELVEETA